MKQKKNWLKWTILLVGLAVVGGGIFWAISSEKLTISFGVQTGKAFTVVCDDGVRSDFFTEFAKTNRNNEDMANLYDSVIQKPDYLSDPNCAFLTFTYSTSVVADRDQATKSLDAIKSLGDKGVSPDAKFTNIPAWTFMQSTVNNLPAPGAAFDGIG